MKNRFVVVVGSPRSGTSLLRTILKSSDALCVHTLEPQYILDLYRRFGRTIKNVPAATELLVSSRKFPHDLVDAGLLREKLTGRSSMSLSEFLHICYGLMKGPTDRAVVLKHPTLILHVDLIRDLFPDLRIIQCVRDPRANAFSQRTRWPSTNLWYAASRWRATIQAGRKLKNERRIPYLEVRYEDLVTAPEPTCRAICSFLQIPFEPSMLAPDHVQRDWNPNNPGHGAKRKYQSFETQRIDKWKAYLTPVEIRLIEARCREGMEQFGYPALNPEVKPGDYYRYYLNARRGALKKTVRQILRRRSDKTPNQPAETA